MNIIVNLQHEATHSWPDCDLQQVEFLRYPHRHIFHITCKKSVTESDREIEIISFKRKIVYYLRSKFGDDFGHMSCEMIAQELLDYFLLSYCSVLEDGENGAEVTAG